MSNTLKIVKKGVSIAVTSTTILWSIGLSALTPVATHAATPGQLIKMSGNAAVYYLGNDNKRYVFPNSTTYFTWYKDFSGVVTVSASELQSYMIGGNVTMRAGTKLAKITTDPKVYAVEPGGKLRWVQTEAIAKTLWGDNWAKMVVDVPDAFFVNYTVGSSISTNTYPTGAIIKSAASSDVYYVDGSSKRKITAAGLTGNNFNVANVATATDAVFNALSMGSDITAAEAAIWNVQGGASTGPAAGQGTGLTVALASDTPVSTVQADGTAYNPVLKLNLTASADGPVTLTGLTVTRTGLSADSDIDGVGVFDASGNRHGNFVSFADTKAMVSFTNDVITVGAGQTVPVWVKTNLGSSVSSGTYAVAVNAATDVKTTAAVSGAFPVSGNGFSMIDGSTSVGGLSIGEQILATSAVTVDIGTTNYLLTKLRFTAGANEPVSIARVRLFNNGTTDDDDIQNYKLVAPNGTVLATSALAKNRYVDFKLTTPYVIAEGNSRDVEVQVDVKDGSSRTAQMNIQNNYDVEVYGVETGSGLLPTAAANDTSFPIGDTSARNTLTVRAGTLTVNKSATSPSGEIGVSTPNTVLAVWDLEAKGEAVEIQRVDLDIGLNSSSGIAAGDFTGTIKLQTVDGTTLASFSPTSTDGGELFEDDAAGSDSQTLSNYLTIPSGTTAKVQLVVDTDSDISSGETVRASISDLYYKQTVSNTFATASAAVFQSGNTLTVTTNSLTVSANAAYASQTLTAGQSNVRLGSVLLKTNNAEGVNITSMIVQFTGADAMGVTDISNVKLMRADTNAQLGNTLASVTDVAGGSNTFSVAGQLNIPANTTVQVDIYGTIASGGSDGDGTGDTLLAVIPATTGVSGVGAQSGATIPANAIATLQTLTFVQSGGLTITIDQSGAESSRFLTTGLTGVEMARIKLATTTEGVKLQKLELRTVGGSAGTADSSVGASGNIDSVKLMGTGLATDPVTQLSSGLATFTFSSGSEIVVGAQSSKILTVVANTTPLQSLVGGQLGVVGFNTADAIGAGSGVSVQEAVAGTSATATAATSNLNAAEGDIIYFTSTQTTGTNVTPGYYMVTTTTGGAIDPTLTAIDLNDEATDTLLVAGTVFTVLDKVFHDSSLGSLSTAVSVGDLLYINDTGTPANSGFCVAANAVAASTDLTAAGANPFGCKGALSAVTLVAADNVTKLTNAAGLVGNTMRFEEVEPVITRAASSPASGNSVPTIDETIGVFSVKAEGGRDMTFNSISLEKTGATAAWNVRDFKLYNGNTLLAEVSGVNANTRSIISEADADPTGTDGIDVADNGTIGFLPNDTVLYVDKGTEANSGVTTVSSVTDHNTMVLAADVIGGTSATDDLIIKYSVTDADTSVASGTTYDVADASKYQVGDYLYVISATDAADSGGATVASVSANSITVTQVALTGIADNAAAVANTESATIYNLSRGSSTVVFNAASPTTALSAQTITAGSTMTLTVKADTTYVKRAEDSNGNITTAAASFGIRLGGNNGPLQVGTTQVEGFNWDYTPLNTNGAATYKTETDSYPVTSGTLSY